MIQIGNGKTTIKGNGIEILSNLSLAVKLMKSAFMEFAGEDRAESAIMTAVRIGLKEVPRLKEEIRGQDKK